LQLWPYLQIRKNMFAVEFLHPPPVNHVTIKKSYATLTCPFARTFVSGKMNTRKTFKAMKNLLPYIISAAALISFPKLDFCQNLQAINLNSAVIAVGTLTFKNDLLVFSGHSPNQVDFDGALAGKPAPPIILLASGGQCSAGSCYGASVDNEFFEIRDYVPFVARVVGQPCSLDGRIPAKTIVSLILDGKSYTAKDGSPFNETVQLELTFADPMLPNSKLSSASLLHNSTVYAMVKGDSSNIAITDLVWSGDHRSFNFTVNFDCIMRCWEHETSGKADVILKGEMSKIQVRVPGYVTASK
jgi:hypothetical protein